jgi:cysteine-rich repeat protein
MSKHIHRERNLLVVLLAAGLSAACMSNPVAGTSEPDASPGPALPEADAKVGSPDTGSVTPDVGIAACGNGVLEPGETCDDGNANGLDGCSATCTLDPGGLCPTPGQPCKLISFCGDGKRDPGEKCDLGINDGRYGSCSPSCTLGPYCGDGIVQSDHEQCDDGINDGRYRGCNPDCTISPVCGDGILQADTEQCDDGNNANADGCSSTCQCENSACGHPGPVCGDGKVDGALGETCDDGNTLNDDGCSDTCQVEPCWNTCGCNSTTPCLPTMICGNGIVEGGESCDDGNATPGDGCSGTCQVEPEWTCVGPGRHCSSVCGDGVLASNEECDDGNARDQDGCSSTCKIEPNY